MTQTIIGKLKIIGTGRSKNKTVLVITEVVSLKNDKAHFVL